MLTAIIIPARNEADCITHTIVELQQTLASEHLVIAVGLNATSDNTGDLAREAGAIVGSTTEGGYGHGCLAAMQALKDAQLSPDHYIFYAADGAHDPLDLKRLIACRHSGAELVLGQRLLPWSNWRHGGWSRRIQNLALGIWVGLLCGRFFTDLGPLRLIEARLFERMRLQELHFGWTIEAQIRAVQLGARLQSIAVTEHERRAGRQQISGVSCRRSLMIGWYILSAGWRSRTHLSTAELPVEAIS